MTGDLKNNLKFNFVTYNYVRNNFIINVCGNIPP